MPEVDAGIAPYWRRTSRKHRIHHWACGWAEGPDLAAYEPSRRELLLLVGWEPHRLEPPRPWCKKCALRCKEVLPREKEIPNE